ncbi:hypothetical protein KI659_09910 [Litoribacter alkaliphilus]|uniref:Anti-sigma factor n=1 Tax=Litoribacter ruber TaxID=702568 RepID=A0AAP2G4B7_9BACT|nr:hypothetical protein [Litoribacter alkaliphilus]MBS9524330.1 hypothetical protein [Litoribacter alkaliphilus]
MEERIEHLLEKYWEGESSLEEEKELRNLLQQANGYEQEKAFFGELNLLQEEHTENLTYPAKKSSSWEWLKFAAVLVVFLSVTALVFQFQKYQERQEEALAYAQVMEAFALINENMNKGTKKLDVMEEFRYLGTTRELFEED